MCAGHISTVVFVQLLVSPLLFTLFYSGCDPLPAEVLPQRAALHQCVRSASRRESSALQLAPSEQYHRRRRSRWFVPIQSIATLYFFNLR